VEPLEIGDRVNILDQNKTKKSQPTYIGPFIIKNITDDGKYNLVDCSNLFGPVSYNVPISHMKLEAKINQNSKLINSDDIYLVEQILAHKGDIGNRKYLIKWKGYSSSENTWEPAANIFNEQLIMDYWNSLNKRTKAKVKN
jgi:hypothetical protein